MTLHEAQSFAALCCERTLAERWADAVTEWLALDTHRRMRRKPLGHTRNWGRILDWHGTSPRARRKLGRRYGIE